MANKTSNITGKRQHDGAACEECRARKLRCDRVQPRCGTCQDLDLICITDPVRRPRGPKKGHVQALKSRIASLERQLHQRSVSQTPDGDGEEIEARMPEPKDTIEHLMGDDKCYSGTGDDWNTDHMDAQPDSMHEWHSIAMSGHLDALASMDDAVSGDRQSLSSSSSTSGFHQLMASMPLIPPDALTSAPTSIDSYQASIDLQQNSALTPPFIGSNIPVQMTELERADLNHIFFERVHFFAPIVNQHRYYSRTAQNDVNEPLVCLQHAMWTLAASMGSQFKRIQPVLYSRAKSMLESWDNNIYGSTVPLELIQAWLLLAIYEVLQDNTKRGWVTAGRCFRLVQLMKMHEIDNPESQHSAIRNNSLTWVELEERRRTFWTAYGLDRYANLVNGLPLMFDEQMILTRLPATEEDFQRQQNVTTEFLSAAMAKKNTQPLSRFGRSIVVVTVLGRCLSHRSQSHVERVVDATSAEYLSRHALLDGILSQEVLGTLDGVGGESFSCSPNSLFIDMLAQATVLILFLALESAHKESQEYGETYGQYERKAMIAADRIHNLTQRMSQLGLYKIHPFTPITLLICGDFANQRQARYGQAAGQFQSILAALQDLCPTNNLARTCLLELEGEYEYPTNTDMVGF